MAAGRTERVDEARSAAPVDPDRSVAAVELLQPDGHTSAVPAVVTGSSQTVAITPGGAGAAHITDTYRPAPGPGAAPGSLFVTKTIAGPLAGRQGPVTIRVVCNGTTRSPDFTIAAAAAAGSVSQSFDGIPARSVCTVNEIADGATATVVANVSGSGRRVAIPAGKVVPVNLMDVYQRAGGVLGVIKTIAGPAARQHGHIAILVACGGPIHRYAFRIPRASPAIGLRRNQYRRDRRRTPFSLASPARFSRPKSG